MNKKLIVIGGGAAGFFCAVNAAMKNPSLEVTLVEKTSKLLSKVKVSGGGRCNVTHACFDIGEMSRRYPRGTNFVKRTFHQFFTNHTVNWFEERGVKLKTEEDGRMFPVSDSSQTIIDCLMKEAASQGVMIKTNTEVKHILKKENHFELQLASGVLKADFICVACGGFPKASMFEWLHDTGHSIETPVPSLFTFNLPQHPVTSLMGIAVPDVRVRIRTIKREERGPLLITHWGFSGPAVLKLSAWAAKELNALQYSFGISINWFPDYNESSLAEHLNDVRSMNGSQRIHSKNFFGLPHRLWDYLLEECEIKEDVNWGDLKTVQQRKLAKTICNNEYDVRGKTTYKEEFVTAGGIKLSEVDANTMMSKKTPNLFFAGEILDVDGITGGYNFQHAWTSGWVAANAIAAKARNA